MLTYQPNQQLNELVSKLHQSIAIDKIFLLGVMADGQPVNSIFSPSVHSGAVPAGYLLLLLTRPGEKRSDDLIQDMLEQKGRQYLPVSLMVYPVKNFYQWLGNGQPFALEVIGKAPLLYDSCITQIPYPALQLREQYELKLKKLVGTGYRRSVEFLAGAQLFALRNEHDLAAFLLHQATEHACLSYLLKYTGLRTGTHNIDKLLRYTTLISDDIINIFPRQEPEEISLFRILQKAYIHSRYKDDFEITAAQVGVLVRKVMQLLFQVCPEILAERFAMEVPVVSGQSMAGEADPIYPGLQRLSTPQLPDHFPVMILKRKIRRLIDLKLPDHIKVALAEAASSEQAELQNKYQNQYDHQYCTY